MGQPLRSGGREAALLAWPNGVVEVEQVALPTLHLDEADPAFALHDDVELATTAAPISSEHSPARAPKRVGDVRLSSGATTDRFTPRISGAMRRVVARSLAQPFLRSAESIFWNSRIGLRRAALPLRVRR